MKFKLKTTGYFYPKETDRRRLGKLGFTFIKGGSYGYHIDWESVPEIEINTINELMEFIDIHGDIIISGDGIEIYDNYRE